MKLTLPFPPSGNLYWRHWRNRVVTTDEAKRYRRGVMMRALTAGFRPFDGPVAVTVGIYRPRRMGDLDNSLKVLLDALRGAAFVDDAQVEELHARRYEDRENPRAEVTVEKL